MILRVFSVKDNAAQSFGRPFFVPSIGVALRSFADEVNRPDKDNQLYNHSDDFDLYHLGDFDDSTCVFDLLALPDLILRGKDAMVLESR